MPGSHYRFMLLALDSTQSSGSLALVRDHQLIYSSYFNLDITHSETLMPELDHALKVVKAGPEQLSGVLLAIGPGSFTGLRIGLATAKGLALGLEIPIYPYNSLELAAVSYYGCDREILAVIDAKMSGLYYALYDQHLGILHEPALCKVEDLADLCLNNPFVVGSGAGKVSSFLLEQGIAHRLPLPFQNTITAIGLLSLHHLKGETLDYDFDKLAALEPLYLRESTAQVRKRKAGELIQK